MKNTVPNLPANPSSSKRLLGFGILAFVVFLLPLILSQWPGTTGPAVRAWSSGEHRGQVDWHGYVDAAGGWVVRPKYPLAREFSDGLAFVQGPLPDHGAAFIDTHGQVVIKQVTLKDGAVIDGKQWREVSDFHEGVAALQHGPSLVFFDRAGNEVLSVRGGSAQDVRFSEGLATVMQGGAAGAIDRAGRWVVKPEYSSIEPFQDGFALAEDKREWVALNAEGVIVARFDAEYVWHLGQGRFVAIKNNLQGLVDSQGEWLLPMAERKLKLLQGERCALYDKASQTVLDSRGKALFTTPWLPEGRFSEGLCSVSDPTGKQPKGYMDEDGKIVFHTANDITYLGPFLHGLAQVGRLEGDAVFSYLVDRQGHVIASDQNGSP